MKEDRHLVSTRAKVPEKEFRWSLMSKSSESPISPIGSTVSSRRQRKLQDPEYREEAERLAPFEKIARLVIDKRHQLGWSQQDLAERMGTTASAISRLESGQHETTSTTMRKIAEAFGGKALIGFEFEVVDATEEAPVRELFAL